MVLVVQKKGARFFQVRVVNSNQKTKSSKFSEFCEENGLKADGGAKAQKKLCINYHNDLLIIDTSRYIHGHK